ncbi:MAG: TolC family protein [Proteobacteria bacterium]|nr:TolC family protein [Pseudomonadota bacterium]
MSARIAVLAAVSIALVGCATFSPDGGFGTVEKAVKDRTGKDIAWVKTEAQRDDAEKRVAELLARSLSADDAVQVALLNNRGLQAEFAELGIGEADLVQAGRLPNPRISMLRTSRDDIGGREYKIEQILTMNVFSLITTPLASEIEARNFERVKRGVTLEVLRLASETRKAYFAALAAEESVRYTRQVKAVADASAELARRMARVGNWGKVEQAREQGFYADAALSLARAEQVRTAARERLIRMLGVWGDQTQLKLPERLPDLPKVAEDLPDIERRAMQERLDLQAVRLDTEALAKNLGLTRTTRFINALEFGPARVLEGVHRNQWKKGYEIGFEIPLFDWGSSRVAKAESLYMQAVDRATEAAVNARSEVRESYDNYRVSWDIARHYREEVVPIRKRIADENLLRYNGMLIGVFELLTDARAQIESVRSAIEALRDFWMAEADLQMSLIGKPNMSAASTESKSAAAPGAGH